MAYDEIYEKVMNSGILEQGIEQGREEGIEQGREEGEFMMALKIRDSLGVDEAIEISGFSKDELESGILNR